MPGNAQLHKQVTEINVRHIRAYDEFLTYSALGGLIIDADTEKIRKMPIYEFCKRVGVDQSTTYRWKHAPGFGMKVRERRNEIMPLARESMVFNQLFILSMQTQDKRAAVDAIKTWLGHFSELQLPVQRQDVEIHGSAEELLKAARDDGILEGEVIETAIPDTPADGADAGALSPAS